METDDDNDDTIVEQASLCPFFQCKD